MSHRPILLFVSCIFGLGLAPSLAQTPLFAVQSIEFVTAQATDPYGEAMRIAQQASEAGKVAQTADEWADLADRWQQAADLMVSVSQQSDRYSMAQQKAAEYRRNSEIASQEEDKRRRTTSLGSPLGPGSTGPRVQELQQSLKSLGHYQGDVDGVYTESTLRGVSAFQEAQGLEVDGLVGQTTWERLQRAQLPIINTDSSPSPSPKTQAKSQSQRKMVRWILIALVIITATGGFSLLLVKLLNRNALRDEEEWEEEEESDRTPTFPPEESLYPVIESPSDEPTQAHHAESSDHDNGHNWPSFTAPKPPPPEPLPPAPLTPAENIPIEETTRLAKVNIVDELIHDLESPDREKRRKAIWELGQRGASQAAQPLVNLLIDSDSQQRSLILAALSEISLRTLKPMNRALAISLKDNNPDVRKNAIRDVTRLYELVTHVSQLMRYATEDPDKDVQETAKWALNQLNRIRPTNNADQLPQWPDIENSRDRSSDD